MILYLILLFIFVVAWGLYFHTQYGRRGRLFSKIPGPKAYPFVGNMLMFNMNSMHDFWVIGRSLMVKLGPIMRLQTFFDSMINVGHPHDLEVLLTSPKSNAKGYVYLFLQPWLKTGLLTSGGEKWRNRRKVLTPAFHFSILKKYIDITQEQGEKLVQDLKNEGDETIKSLIPFCSNYTLNIICESTMGVALDKMDDRSVKSYKEAIHNMGKVVLYRLARPYLTDWLLSFLKMGVVQEKALSVLHKITDQVIEERREYHRSTDNKYLQEYTDDVDDTVYSDYYKGHKKRLAMLDLLLTAEKNGLIDNEGVKEEVDTFTFEGHDTTAMALTFTLMLLAEHNEIQSQVRAEVTEVFDKYNGKLGMTELQELNYLERCIKESLRMYPPVATIMRYTDEELQLKHALLPTKTHVLIHFWDTHRNSKFWPDPDKFDPDRFLPENSINRHPFAYVPFSAGPRNCIGQKFAMMELKMVIGKILYDFYLEPIDRTTDMKLIADIILRPLDPVRVKFIRINK